MMTLYHCVSARSFRPLWTLEELGLQHGSDYQLAMLPFPPRVRARAYLDVNPLGTVPALVDGATVMTESAAMCQYLVARHGPSPMAIGPDEADYGAWLNALHFGEATLTFPQTLVLRYSRFEPPERRQPQVVEDYSKWFLARLRAVERVVAHQQWWCTGRFTVADVSVGYALMLAEDLGLLEQAGPATRAYWQRLQDRAGFRQALAVQHAAAQAQGVPTQPAPQTGT